MTAARTSRWIAAQATALAVVLVAALVAALTLQAPTPAGADTLRLVGAAGQAAADAGSYRMEMAFSVEASGLELDFGGTADVVAATGDARGELEVPGGQVIRFLSTDGRGWFELPESSPSRLGGKRWVGFPLPEGGAPVTEDPLELLELIAGDGEVLDMGSDQVRGVDVRQYRARLDSDALAALADQQQDNPLIGSQLRSLDGEGQLDVWVSDDGLPRRLQVAFAAQGVSAVFSFELYEYGVEVDVTPPPAAEVIDVPTQAEAGGFLGGG